MDKMQEMFLKEVLIPAAKEAFKEVFALKCELVKEGELSGIMPTKAHPEDAGFDLYCPQDIDWTQEQTSIIIDTLVKFQIPRGCVGLVLPRSSMSKQGLIAFTGVIDHGYTGTIKVGLTKGNEFVKLTKGQRIAQLVVLPLYPFNDLPLQEGKVESDGERQDKGFGSSGK